MDLDDHIPALEVLESTVHQVVGWETEGKVDILELVVDCNHLVVDFDKVLLGLAR